MTDLDALKIVTEWAEDGVISSENGDTDPTFKDALQKAGEACAKVRDVIERIEKADPIVTARKILKQRGLCELVTFSVEGYQHWAELGSPSMEKHTDAQIKAAMQMAIVSFKLAASTLKAQTELRENFYALVNQELMKPGA